MSIHTSFKSSVHRSTVRETCSMPSSHVRNNSLQSHELLPFDSRSYAVALVYCAVGLSKALLDELPNLPRGKALFACCRSTFNSRFMAS